MLFLDECSPNRVHTRSAPVLRGPMSDTSHGFGHMHPEIDYGLTEDASHQWNRSSVCARFVTRQGVPLISLIRCLLIGKILLQFCDNQFTSGPGHHGHEASAKLKFQSTLFQVWRRVLLLLDLGHRLIPAWYLVILDLVSQLAYHLTPRCGCFMLVRLCLVPA
jgi:hypothetical protein